MPYKQSTAAYVFPLLSSGAFLSALVTLSFHVYSHQPRPYMDEIFHIPQTRFYCNGSFNKWDPMITTLPGLYIFAMGLLQGINTMLNLESEELCSVMNLRMVNCLLGALNFYIIFHILQFKKSYQSVVKTGLETLSISLLPVLFFFNTLYYTDVGSTFLVLYSYYMFLMNDYPVSAIFGIISMLFRQTNIVWVFFMALTNVVKAFERTFNRQPDWSIGEHIRGSLIPFVKEVFATCWAYIIAGMMAVGFVIWNESIVVGDKTAHEACFHPVQVGYFAAFTLAHMLPYLVTADKIRSFFSLNVKKIVLLSLVAIGCFIAVKYFTLEHQYLLADNRHFTFYVWKKILRRNEYTPYAMIAVYIYALWAINDSLKHRSILYRLGLAFCIFAALAPQKLLEFRYFILPYMFIRLNQRTNSYIGWQMLIELLVHGCINVIVFYIFLFKPIYWPDSYLPQRIMW